MPVFDDHWKGQVAVVTGAAGAMGSETVRALRVRGVDVAGLDQAEALRRIEVPQDLPGRFLGLDVDIADPAAVSDAFKTVDSKLGLTSLLVNFAGITSGRGSLLDTKAEDLDRMMAVNVNGPFWTCREAFSRMKGAGAGSIVNISSTNGLMARRYDFTHAYAASKAAVVGLTKSFAAEAAAYGVRVNCVAPGIHLGPMQLELMGSGDDAAGFIKTAVAFTPLGRAGTGADMVGPVLFLLGTDSAYMTGQVIVSDGGRSMWYE